MVELIYNTKMADLIVRLTKSTDHNETFDLEYDFLDNPFIPKWKDRFRLSLARGDDISTRDQFYGINNEWTPEKTMSIINDSIDKLNAMVPGLIDRKIDSVGDQDTLNYLHSFFERYHGKIDSWLTDPWWKDKPREMRPIWSDLNNYIHRLEGYRSGKPNPRIKVAWYDTPKTKKFDKEDYRHFTVGHRFGYMYSLYSDVGKDLRSLAYDDDEHHLDFVPPTYYSADFHLRFHTESDDKVQEIRDRCQRFYDRNKEYFMEKGFHRNDPRLVMGSIPIAKLNTWQRYWHTETFLLDHIKDFNRIQSVILL